MAAHVRARGEKSAIPASAGMNYGEPVIAPFGSVSLGLLHGLRGVHDSGLVTGGGPGGEPYGTSDFLSHRKGRRAFHLLQRGWTARCADAPLAAPIPLLLADLLAAF